MHEIGPRQPLPTTDRKRTHRVALTVAHRPPCPDHREGDDEQRSDSGSVDRGSTDRDDRPRAARTPSKEHECRMATVTSICRQTGDYAQDMARDPDVQLVVDELEIRNRVAELAQLADAAPDDELDRYLALLTEDATWVVVADNELLKTQERKGHSEILEGVRQRRAEGVQGPGTDTRHVVSTLVVTFETSDRAMARCYWQYFTNASSSAPVLALMGEYRNTFVRTPAGWKLARREVIPG